LDVGSHSDISLFGQPISNDVLEIGQTNAVSVVIARKRPPVLGNGAKDPFFPNVVGNPNGTGAPLSLA